MLAFNGFLPSHDSLMRAPDNTPFQEALERNDHATAYAQLSQENSEGNLPYPYLVSKGVAALGLGKEEVRT